MRGRGEYEAKDTRVRERRKYEPGERDDHTSNLWQDVPSSEEAYAGPIHPGAELDGESDEED
jgi:hypothetical protein